MTALQIQYRPIESLVPNARNARKHSDWQITQLAASIREFGFNGPVLIDGNRGVIAGYGRILAARKLGMTELPVIELKHLTATQKKAFVLADNKLAEYATWDNDLLGLELSELQDAGFDLELTGFDEEQIQSLLMSQAEALESTEPSKDDPADEVPDTSSVQTVSQTGDLWVLGEHRLICGDASDPAVIAALMGAERATLCFTSPPYGNQRDYTKGRLDWDAMMQGMCAALPMAEDGQVLVNLGLVHRDNEVFAYWEAWLAWMQAQGWRRFAWYVWDQGPGLPGDWNGRFAPAFEFVFHFNRHGSQARQPHKIVPCGVVAKLTKGVDLFAS